MPGNRRVEIYLYPTANDLKIYKDWPEGWNITSLCGEITITQKTNDTGGKCTLTFMVVPYINLRFGQKLLVKIDAKPVFIGTLFDISNAENALPVRRLVFYDWTRYLQNKLYRSQNELQTTSMNFQLIMDSLGIPVGHVDEDSFEPLPMWMGKFDGRQAADIIKHYLDLSWGYHNVYYQYRCNVGRMELVDLVKLAIKQNETFTDAFPAILSFNTNETIDRDVYTISNFYLDESDVKNIKRHNKKQKKNSSGGGVIFAQEPVEYVVPYEETADLQSPTIHEQIFAKGLGVQTSLVMPEISEYGPLIYNKVYKMEQAETVKRNAAKFADEHRLPLRTLSVSVLMNERFYLPCDMLYIYGDTADECSRYVIDSVTTKITNASIIQELHLQSWHKKFEPIQSDSTQPLLRGESTKWLEQQKALIKLWEADAMFNAGFDLITRSIEAGNEATARQGAFEVNASLSKWFEADLELIKATAIK